MSPSIYVPLGVIAAFRVVTLVLGLQGPIAVTSRIFFEGFYFLLFAVAGFVFFRYGACAVRRCIGLLALALLIDTTIVGIYFVILISGASEGTGLGKALIGLAMGFVGYLGPVLLAGLAGVLLARFLRDKVRTS